MFTAARRKKISALTKMNTKPKTGYRVLAHVNMVKLTKQTKLPEKFHCLIFFLRCSGLHLQPALLSVEPEVHQ